MPAGLEFKAPVSRATATSAPPMPTDSAPKPSMFSPLFAIADVAAMAHANAAPATPTQERVICRTPRTPASRSCGPNVVGPSRNRKRV